MDMIGDSMMHRSEDFLDNVIIKYLFDILIIAFQTLGFIVILKEMKRRRDGLTQHLCVSRIKHFIKDIV